MWILMNARASPASMERRASMTATVTSVFAYRDSRGSTAKRVNILKLSNRLLKLEEINSGL